MFYNSLHKVLRECVALCCFLVALFSGSGAVYSSSGSEKEALLESYSALMALDLDKKVKDAIKFPELIICGGQSSGKTSTLNRLLGVRLPVSSKTTTTVPTCIHTRKSNEDGTHAIIEFCGQSYKVPESGLAKKINDLQNSLKKGNRDKGFSTDQLNIYLKRKQCIPLSILDLPGRLNGSDRKNVKKLNEIYAKYLNCDSIVLFVTKGDDDTSDTFELFYQLPELVQSQSNGDVHFPRGLLVYTSATSRENIDHYLIGDESVARKYEDDCYTTVGLGIHFLENYGMKLKEQEPLIAIEVEAEPPPSSSYNLTVFDPLSKQEQSCIGTSGNSSPHPAVNGQGGNPVAFSVYDSPRSASSPDNGYEYNEADNRAQDKVFDCYTDEEEKVALERAYPKSMHDWLGIGRLRERITDTVIKYLSDDELTAKASNILHERILDERNEIKKLHNYVESCGESFRKSLHSFMEQVKALFSVDSVFGDIEVISAFKNDLMKLQCSLFLSCFGLIDGFKICMCWHEFQRIEEEEKDEGLKVARQQEQSEKIVSEYKRQFDAVFTSISACLSKEFSYTNVEALYIRYSKQFFEKFEGFLKDYVTSVSSLVKKAIVDLVESSDEHKAKGVISSVFFAEEAQKKSQDIADKIKEELTMLYKSKLADSKFSTHHSMNYKTDYVRNFRTVYDISDGNDPGWADRLKTYMMTHQNRLKLLGAGTAVAAGSMAALSLASTALGPFAPVGVGATIAVAAATGNLPSASSSKLRRMLSGIKRYFSKAKQKDEELTEHKKSFVVADAVESVKFYKGEGAIMDSDGITKKWNNIFKEVLGTRTDEKEREAILEALCLLSAHHAQIVEDILLSCFQRLRSCMSTHNPDAFLHQIYVRGFSDVENYVDKRAMENTKKLIMDRETVYQSLESAYKIFDNIKRSGCY